MYKIAIFLLVNFSLSNIWDNIYSQGQDAIDTVHILDDFRHTWRVVDSFLFKDYQIDLMVSPKQNSLIIDLHRETFQIKLVLLMLENKLWFKTSKGCYKYSKELPIKFDLININNMWRFSFFKESEGVYLMDLGFINLDKKHIPETRIYYTKVGDTKKVDKIELKFITQVLVLENVENLAEVDFGKAIEDLSHCEEIDSMQNLIQKVKDLAHKNLPLLINQMYERIVNK